MHAGWGEKLCGDLVGSVKEVGCVTAVFRADLGRCVALFMGSEPPHCRVLDVVERTNIRLW